jgi:hypothetical protein
MKLLAAAIAVAALGLPSAQASSPATVPGLVYTAGYGNSIVARYDPLTLARTGPRVRLGGNASSWSWSPGRRYLAVASFPQRLTVIEVATMRVVSRVRLASGGASVRAVTWARGDRVLAVIETPRGSTVTAVDPLAGHVVRTTRLARPFAYQFGRLSDGLVFLLGARNRIGPVQLAVVDAEGMTRVVTVRQVVVGMVVWGSGRFEQRVPGLAVDPLGRKAYLVDGERVFGVDLRTLDVSYPGPLRTLAKVPFGVERSARWLGGGLLAVSGLDRDDAGGTKPAGLRLVDVRQRTTRTIDPAATTFTVAGRALLVESAPTRRALNVTAYGFDGRQRYRLDLTGSTWMKKQGRLGYACRDAYLRSVVDLAMGSTRRTGFPAKTRCPTLLVGDSRG